MEDPRTETIDVVTSNMNEKTPHTINPNSNPMGLRELVDAVQVAPFHGPTQWHQIMHQIIDEARTYIDTALSSRELPNCSSEAVITLSLAVLVVEK
jgi:hypothetical protein